MKDYALLFKAKGLEGHSAQNKNSKAYMSVFVFKLKRKFEKSVKLKLQIN